MSAAMLKHDDALTPDRAFLDEDFVSDSVPPAATIPARAAFALGVLYLLMLLLASRLPLPAGRWAAPLSIVLFVYLPMAIIYHGVRVPLSAGTEALSGLISLGVWLALVGLERQADASLTVPGANVALLAACLFFGMLTSRLLRERNILLPALVAAGVIDVLSVGWGFTGHALSAAPGLVAKLSVAVPTVAPPAAPGAAPHFALLATMGVGDFFFLALFFAAAARFELPLRRTFCVVFPLVLAAMFLTVLRVLPWGGVPGLPFIAAGFLLANFRAFQLSPTERRDFAIVGGILALVVAALFLVRAWLS